MPHAAGFRVPTDTREADDTLARDNTVIVIDQRARVSAVGGWVTHGETTPHGIMQRANALVSASEA